MSLDHKVVNFNQFLVHEDVLVFEAVVLQQRVDRHVAVDSLRGLVSYSEQKEEYVFEIDNADHHP